MKKNILILLSAIFVILSFIFILNKSSKPKGLVAFVIDDWGYNKKNLDLLNEIDRPLTLAILPNLHYSKYIAREVKKNNKIHDLILHLPLESKSNRAAEQKTIRSSMKEDEILSILEGNIESVPGIIGVSNHQGSKATEDKRIIQIIFNELKTKDLFFLDSLTTSKSVCSDIASKLGLKYVKRDVFLDLTDQTDLEHFESYIKKQIGELASVALEKGSAIGIGHNKKITLQIIKDSIPELENEGLKIVFLKELIK